MNRIEIPFSKTKLFLGIVGSILFVVGGYHLFANIADEQTRYNPLLLKTVGIAGIVFFSTAAIYGTTKIFDSRMALIIDDEGITDNTNASAIGIIPWSEITDIRTEQIMSTKFLLIYTNDPDRIIDSAKGIKRKLLAASMRNYGTPLSITSNTLKYNFDELETVLRDRLHSQRQGKHSSEFRV